MGLVPGSTGCTGFCIEKLALLFVGAEPWRSGARALCELEWYLTGEARVVIDAACKRAALIDGFCRNHTGWEADGGAQPLHFLPPPTPRFVSENICRNLFPIVVGALGGGELGG